MIKLPPEERPILAITVLKPDRTKTMFCALKLNYFVSLLDEKGRPEKIAANFFTGDNITCHKFIWSPAGERGILSIDAFGRSHSSEPISS